MNPQMLRRMPKTTWRVIRLCVQYYGAHTDPLAIYNQVVHQWLKLIITNYVYTLLGVRRLLTNSVYIDFQLIQIRLLTNKIVCKYYKIETLIGKGGSRVKLMFNLYIVSQSTERE